MDYVKMNKHLLRCAYDSTGRNQMKRFFFGCFISITGDIIKNTERRLDIHAKEEFKEFLVHFYTEAIAGILIDEFMGKEDHDPEKVVEYFALVLKHSLPNVLENVQIGT